jgi:3-dehydroquinate synthase
VDRNDTVVALGGGVTGDLAGFVAATVLRGISFIQMPTTMLAMADAAIGGKTGINVGAGKNLVGSFYQPEAVLCWLPSLKSLDARELRSGMAEVVKSALIDGDEAVERVRDHASAALDYDIEALAHMAEIGAGLKARIVSDDVHEKGVRSYLNLGHTFGHAIEHAQGYGEWTHGEAISAGMVIAARYSVDHGHAEPSFTDTVIELLEAFDLPTEPPSMSLDEWETPIFRDKKRQGDSVKLILATGVGGVFAEPTEFRVLSKWLKDSVAA